MNPAAEIVIPETGMSKKLLVQANGARVMGFGFAAGHALKEHTAPGDVILYFVDGEAEVTLSGSPQVVGSGSMLHIPARLPHSVRAVTPVKMLLTLLTTAA